MLRLTLIRHAKSSWSDAALSDFERPLNTRGLRDAPVMAGRFKALCRQPDRLISSPALRAISTARVFAGELGLAESDIDLQPQIYDASRATLIEVARQIAPAVRHALLFGHNPGFSDLARWLATCPFEDMPTCAIVSLELHIGAWSELGQGCGRLVNYLYPKDDA
ncbi:MAG: SixA phosphatase family protein [Panacagrimonas sp.]